MAADNKLELVIEAQADKANASIKGVNQGLAGIERIAVSVAKNASTGIDGMTASMVKGSLAGNLLAESIRGAAEWVKEYVSGAVEMAAHTERLQIGTQVLAKARGVDAKAARDQVEAIKEIGYTTENATEIINRMLVAGQNLQRSQALAKVAKDLYAIGLGSSPAETVEKMLLAVETGAKFGSPIGGVIGGAIGFGAGLIRLFFKGATEKARDKVRAAYGVDVKDKAVLQQIVDTAKQTFGGNIDMAIRSARSRKPSSCTRWPPAKRSKGCRGRLRPSRSARRVAPCTRSPDTRTEARSRVVAVCCPA